MRRVLVRGWVVERGRLLLMMVAVALGVALVSAGFVVTASARAAIVAVYAAPGATADLVVRPPAGRGTGLALAEAAAHLTIGTPVLAIPTTHLAGYLATAMAIGILASALPAHRAARLPVLAAAAHR